jgi:hypothetical protein
MLDLVCWLDRRWRRSISRWERYLGVPDDLPTRFVVEDLDLQTNGQACQLSCHHSSFAVKSEETPIRLYGLVRNDGGDEVPRGGGRGRPRHHLGVYGLGCDGRGLVVRHGAGGGREATRAEGRRWLAKLASGGRRRGGMDELRREREGDWLKKLLRSVLVPRHLAAAWAVRGHVPAPGRGSESGPTDPCRNAREGRNNPPRNNSAGPAECLSFSVQVKLWPEPRPAEPHCSGQN